MRQDDINGLIGSGHRLAEAIPAIAGEWPIPGKVIPRCLADLIHALRNLNIKHA
jgi:hypothetical protein